MSAEQGADELRIKAILIKQGVGPDANEQLTRRILGGLGVRPVGHQDPNANPGTATTAPAVAPTVPAQRANRLPPWWEAKKPVVDTGPEVPAAPAADPVEDGEDQDDDTADEEEAPVPGLDPTGPVEKAATDSKGRTWPKISARKKAEEAVEDPRMRILLFNGSAAGVGQSLGLVDVVKAYLPAAEQAATGVFGFALAVGGAWTAWKILGHDAVKVVLGQFAPLARLLGAAGAAEVARRLARVPVMYANAYGQEYGLGPSAISLLLTAGGICGGLWWGIDRRIRGRHWAVRWFFRIPLASALLATALHTSAPVL